jgi:hypothetical protein
MCKHCGNTMSVDKDSVFVVLANIQNSVELRIPSKVRLITVGYCMSNDGHLFRVVVERRNYLASSPSGHGLVFVVASRLTLM